MARGPAKKKKRVVRKRKAPVGGAGWLSRAIKKVGRAGTKVLRTAQRGADVAQGVIDRAAALDPTGRAAMASARLAAARQGVRSVAGGKRKSTRKRIPKGYTSNIVY